MSTASSSSHVQSIWTSKHSLLFAPSPNRSHSLRALFLVQWHSTAQSNCCTTRKRGARGAEALAEIPQEPQPPPALIFVWPVSLPMTRFQSHNANSSSCVACIAMQECRSWLNMLKFSKVPWLAIRIWFIAQLLITAYHPQTSHSMAGKPLQSFGRICQMVQGFRHQFALGLHGKMSEYERYSR